MILIGILMVASVSAENFVRVERDFSIPSFVGYVDNEIIVVLKEQYVPTPTSKALASENAFSGMADFAPLAQKFEIQHAIKQFKGTSIGKATSAQHRELAKYFKVKFAAGTLDEVVAAYEALPQVEHVERIGVHSLYAAANDTYYKNSPNP